MIGRGDDLHRRVRPGGDDRLGDGRRAELIVFGDEHECRLAGRFDDHVRQGRRDRHLAGDPVVVDREADGGAERVAGGVQRHSGVPARELVEGGDDVEPFGDAFAVLGTEVEAQSMEATRDERDEHRFDDDIEPVAAAQRVGVADDDGAEWCALGLHEITRQAVSIGRRELHVFHGLKVPSGRGTGPDKLPIKMLNDRLLVRIPDKDGERRSSGGILIPATAQMAKRLVWAEVVALGQNVRSAEVGDNVLFSPDDRYEVEVQGDDYIMLRERDLHAVAAKRIEASTGLYL